MRIEELRFVAACFPPAYTSATRREIFHVSSETVTRVERGRPTASHERLLPRSTGDFHAKRDTTADCQRTGVVQHRPGRRRTAGPRVHGQPDWAQEPDVHARYASRLRAAGDRSRGR